MPGRSYAGTVTTISDSAAEPSTEAAQSAPDLSTERQSSGRARGRLFNPDSYSIAERRRVIRAGAAQQACHDCKRLDDRYFLLGVAAGFWTTDAIESAVEAQLERELVLDDAA